MTLALPCPSKTRRRACGVHFLTKMDVFVKRSLLAVDVVACLVAVWVAVGPPLIERMGVRFALFAVCMAWLLFRWSRLAMSRSRVLRSAGSRGRKAEAYFLRGIVALMAAIAVTIAVCGEFQLCRIDPENCQVLSCWFASLGYRHAGRGHSSCPSYCHDR